MALAQRVLYSQLKRTLASPNLAVRQVRVIPAEPSAYSQQMSLNFLQHSRAICSWKPLVGRRLIQRP